ncbi:MAG: hypothetical protein WC144_00755 [Sulfurimonas sp.]|jgi:hypothetical protein|nr:hypothetical protein [Sulfurimonadaceae bacterium]
MKKILKELIVYIAIFIILAPIQHADLLSSPMQRVSMMVEQQNYTHPFIWVFIVYVLVGIFRIFLNYILKFRRPKS